MPLLTDLIQEYQSRPLPVLTPREVDIAPQGTMVPTVIGMRRSGKTYRLYQEMQRLIDSGVPNEHLLYFNFEDARLQELLATQMSAAKLFEQLWETFYRLNPTARQSSCYFFFDEIQALPDWARFARTLVDAQTIQLYFSGSSAKLLSTDIATSFRGRSLPVELLPFSFREYLRHKNIELSFAHRSLHAQAFDEYLDEGGFPSAVGVQPAQRIEILQSFTTLVVMRDLIERHGLSNAVGVRELVGILLNNNAQPTSIHRLTNQLKSRNITISRKRVAELCAYLTDAFLIFSVGLYSRSLQKVRTNPQKIYAIDPGLALANSVNPNVNRGQRLEQAVYLELRRRYRVQWPNTLSYYLTKERKEVDFIVEEYGSQQPPRLFQVCADLTHTATRQREIDALTQAMRELKIREAQLITLYDQERVETGDGIIEIRPAHRWFLGEYE